MSLFRGRMHSSVRANLHYVLNALALYLKKQIQRLDKLNGHADMVFIGCLKASDKAQTGEFFIHERIGRHAWDGNGEKHLCAWCA